MDRANYPRQVNPNNRAMIYVALEKKGIDLRRIETVAKSTVKAAKAKKKQQNRIKRIIIGVLISLTVFFILGLIVGIIFLALFATSKFSFYFKIKKKYLPIKQNERFSDCFSILRLI